MKGEKLVQNCLYGNRRWGWLIGLLLLLSSCANENHLVVFADPWYGEFPEKALEEFQKMHPETEVELRLLSSEVIAQRIRYDDPIDVFLCLRPETMEDFGLSNRVKEMEVLAGMRVVLVETHPEIRQPELGGTHCWSRPAHGRPLYHYIEEWEAPVADSCWLTANFCRQTQDYPLRGWTRGGYLPDFFASRFPEKLTILREGEHFPAAFTAFRLREAQHEKQADLFMKFLASEKCKTLLAEENIIE